MPWKYLALPRRSRGERLSRLVQQFCVRPRIFYACRCQRCGKRFHVPMAAAWFWSGYFGLLIATSVASSVAEPGPALWGAFLGFGGFCCLASAVLYVFAVMREFRPALVTAKALSAGICFGVSGFCVAMAYDVLVFRAFIVLAIIVIPLVACVAWVCQCDSPFSYTMPQDVPSWRGDAMRQA